MIRTWRKSFGEGGEGEPLLTDVSKAFGCLLHELLIAKLHAYGGRYHFLKTITSILN